MAYVIGPACVADYSCVEVCPADCIRPRPDDPDFDTTEQLYIDPGRCIDCQACVAACPVDAVRAQASLPRPWATYAAVNADYYRERGR
jgi:ferredoxin--NADP+ reductase